MTIVLASDPKCARRTGIAPWREPVSARALSTSSCNAVSTSTLSLMRRLVWSNPVGGSSGSAIRQSRPSARSILRLLPARRLRPLCHTSTSSQELMPVIPKHHKTATDQA